jgi:hypothetical protein
VERTLNQLSPAFPLNISSFETAHSLGFYTTPMCISSSATGALNGTGCIVHNEDGTFGLTAKHVLLGLQPDETTPRTLTGEEEGQTFDVIARHSTKSRDSINDRYLNASVCERWAGSTNLIGVPTKTSADST